MSNIFVHDIVGRNGFDLQLPDDDTELATATSRLATQINTLSADFVYDRIIAWVETKDGASPPRTLNCLIERFQYDSGGGDEECPDASETEDMTDDIRTAIQSYDSPNTSIGPQDVHIFTGRDFNWLRDASGGFVYPNTATDDVVVGGHVTPAAKWFNDGDLVIGDDQMSGTERLRVVGTERVEGGLMMTERASVTSPSGGEGIYWVENTAPTLPKFTDDSPSTATLLYGSAGLSLYQIDQVLIVDKAGGATYTPDGTQQRPYNSIGAAITAANALTPSPSSSNRILILIYPGVYDEALTTADQYVYFAGFDRDSTIIRQSSGTSPPLDLDHGYSGFKNLTFECAGTHTGRIVNAATSLGSGVPAVFENCAFLGNGSTSTNNWVDVQGSGDYTFFDCSFTQGNNGQIIYQVGASRQTRDTFFNCDFIGRVNYGNAGGTGRCEAHNCTYVSNRPTGSDGTLRIRFTLPDYRFFGCHFENLSAFGNAVYADLDSTVFEDCTFVGGSSAFDISWDNNSRLTAHNCRFTRGLGNLVMPDDEQMYVGSGPHTVPFHRQLNDCIRAANTNTASTYRVTLLEDQTLAAQLTSLGSGRDMRIDGQGIYTISRAGARIIQMSNVNVPMRFERVRLRGEVYVTNAGAGVYFKEARLEGRVWLQNTAFLRAEDSVFVGDATYTSVLEINSAECSAYYDGCYLKGHTGNAAVNYNVTSGTTYDMDNLYMNETVCLHGSLSTNNPFSGQGQGATPPVNDYYAKQCVFNQEPDVADSTYLANQIDSGQRQNTIDPDGDYTWLAAW
jgi:hypothetical protein